MNIVVLTGAGISAESGLNTFRDVDGLWEGHDVMTVASIQGWQDDPELVLSFYNERRKKLLSILPNKGHEALVTLAKHHDVTIITQNVDDLHERAGSEKILHLHGELLKVQSTENSSLIYPWKTDLVLGDTCELGAQLRPFIVWFGEDVPKLDEAISHVIAADAVIIVGTSMSVYPAAGLVSFAQASANIYYIDPKPNMNEALSVLSNLTVIKTTAVEGLPKLIMKLNNKTK